MHRLWWGSLLWLTLVLGGCISAHRVRIESDPPGAEVIIHGRSLGPTPVEVTMLWLPGRSWWLQDRSTARLDAPGYRDGRIRMGRHTMGAVFWDTLLFAIPDEFNGAAPWKWRWGHLARLVGVDVRHTHKVELIRRHGRAGTWTPEDAERLK